MFPASKPRGSLQALHGPYSIRAADLSKEYWHAFLGVENIIVGKKSESQ
jgi:hypothetical protein